MMTLPIVLFTLLAPSARASSTGPNAARRACERLLFRSHARATDDFLKKARERIDAPGLDVTDARWIGDYALTYPEIAFEPARANVTGPLGRLLADPERARAFFGANPLNGLFVGSLISVGEGRRGTGYDFLKDPIEALVSRRSRQIAKRYPGFDVVYEQGAAMVVARWADVGSEIIETAAERFMNPPHRHWSIHRWHEWTRKLENAYGYRAATAASYLNGRMRRGLVPAALVDRLIASAGLIHHPHQTDLWRTFAVENLTEDQLDRLREVWQGLGVSVHAARWIRHESPTLVSKLDVPRSVVPR